MRLATNQEHGHPRDRLMEHGRPSGRSSWPGEEVGVQALNLLRQALWQMDGTSADRTRIETPEEISDDPTDRFFDA
jgi:hypothetical protein